MCQNSRKRTSTKFRSNSISAVNPFERARDKPGLGLIAGLKSTTLKNIKLLSSYQKDYEGFKTKYLELVEDFKNELSGVDENGGETAFKRNEYRKVLYLRRFDLIVKPITLRLKDPDIYNKTKEVLWKLIVQTCQVTKYKPGLVQYMYELNAFFNLAPPIFPDSNRKPQITLKFEDNQSIELITLIVANILKPIKTILSNQGFTLEIENNVNLRDLPDNSKLVDVSSFEFQLKADILLKYHKPISKSNMAAFTILVCEPSSLKEYIKDFKNDKGRYTLKSANFKNLVTQAFCQSVFVLNNFGIITDYNSFLLFKVDQDLKLECQKSSIMNKRAKNGGLRSSGLHCEVIHIKDGLCIAKLASFISDSVKSVIDNSEECLIRQLKGFCVKVD
ncbi:unnamed protein product [Wickerhamomyces anomalus]